MRGAVAAAALAALALLGCRLSTQKAEARARLDALEDILRSRNDNDPRLDREFNALSREAKSLFRRKYRELPPERRNDRGIIIHLLGRNIRAAEDWEFLREAALEPACLSLADCAKSPAPSEGPHSTDDEVTLAYPSLVALEQARKALDASPGKREALELISAAKNSQAPAVVRRAERLERTYAP